MRIVRVIVAVGAAALVTTGAVAPAAASVGPRPYQVLAAAQARQLMAGLTTQFDQVSSPETCDRAATRSGALLLPALAGRAGNRTFNCTTRANMVLVDLAGFICSEDNDPDDLYTTTDGRVLRFQHGNLETICSDVIRQVTPATLTVDGHAITHHHVAVGTPEFVSTVASTTGGYWQASVDLGHPGRLWTAYGGYKQLLYLEPGRHTIVTDLSAIIGAPTVLTFQILVRA